MIVPMDYFGQRVDVVLAQLFPDFSRSQLVLWLKEGAITLNQRPYKPKEKVIGGEHIVLNITLNAQEIQDEAEDIQLSIVYEDDHVLVINKPSGLVVHPGAGNPSHTLVNALLFHDPTLHHLPRAGIIHRLDKETTGLLIIGKTLESYTHFIRQMQAREIQRHYLTLVHGHVISGGVIDTFYGRHPHNRLKMAVCDRGKQAVTEYTLRKQYHHFTLLDVKLMTGRTHQIRVHMAHIHHPVVGDPLYGGRKLIPPGISESLKLTLQQFKRQALHAYQLTFTHPDTQESLTLVAPIPDDFQTILTQIDHDLN